MSLIKQLFCNRYSAFLGLLLLTACDTESTDAQKKSASNENKKPAVTDSRKVETGQASWYGPGFQGQETASGETFDQNKMTAAHPSLPMGTKVEVTNLDNGEKVEVRINDRGPYAEDRAIDLSREAAKRLDMEKDGTSQVTIRAKPAR